MSDSRSKSPIQAEQVRWQPVVCAFCGGRETKFFNHEGWPWQTEYVRCVQCDLIFLQPRPKLDLPGDRTFRDFTREPGIQDQGVGEFNGLAHGHKVAKRYRVSRGFISIECCVENSVEEGLK